VIVFSFSRMSRFAETVDGGSVAWGFAQAFSHPIMSVSMTMSLQYHHLMSWRFNSLTHRDQNRSHPHLTPHQFLARL
jgi:hypothetical protein